MAKLQHEVPQANAWRTVVTAIGQIFRWVPPIYFIFAAIMIGIGLTNENFFTHYRNTLNLLLQAAPLAVLAAGQLFDHHLRRLRFVRWIDHHVRRAWKLDHAQRESGGHLLGHCDDVGHRHCRWIVQWRGNSLP